AERELRTNLAAKKQTIRAMRSARAAEAADFAARLADAENEASQLRAAATEATELSSLQTTRLEADVRERERRLAESEAQLQRIKSTLGWRVLSRYGQVKHRLLLPLVYGLRHVAEQVMRRRYELTVEPLHDVQRLDGGRWQSVGNDPQFNVRGKWPQSWAEVSLDVATEQPVIGSARLYVDRGAGYNESDSVDLGRPDATRRAY